MTMTVRDAVLQALKQLEDPEHEPASKIAVIAQAILDKAKAGKKCRKQAIHNTRFTVRHMLGVPLTPEKIEQYEERYGLNGHGLRIRQEKAASEKAPASEDSVCTHADLITANGDANAAGGIDAAIARHERAIDALHALKHLQVKE